MAYKVKMTERAREQLDSFVRYLLIELKNEQAALSLLEDASDAEESLSYVAGSIPFCGDPDLIKREIRKFRFAKHRYIWLYRIEGDTAFVMAMYHELQDYENTFRESV